MVLRRKLDYMALILLIIATILVFLQISTVDTEKDRIRSENRRSHVYEYGARELNRNPQRGEDDTIIPCITEKNATDRRIDDEKFLSIPFLATASGAGFGNRLFEVLALFGMANSTGRRPLINVYNGVSTERIVGLIQLFPDLLDTVEFRLMKPEKFSTVYINAGGCCRYESVGRIQQNRAQFLLGYGVYFQSYKYFHHIRKWLLEITKPRESLRALARTILPETNATNICVHGRRGDFVVMNHHLPSQEDFTRAGTEYLINKYCASTSCNVVLMSNDQTWMEMTFIDVILNGKVINSSVYSGSVVSENYILWPLRTPNHEMDFVFSYEKCDVVLLTAPASTFGWFLGYFGKKGDAKVYYYEKFSTPGGIERQFSPQDFFLPEWKSLRLHSNWTVEEL